MQKGLGNAVVMAILSSENESEYFAVYAESENMTAEELLKTVSGNVDVRCNWGDEYTKHGQGLITLSVLSWNH